VSAALSLCKVFLAYRSGDQVVEAVSEVSLEVPERGFTGIIGPSGSGKSSLLYLMSGLRLPTRGSVRFRGQPLEALSDEARAALRRRHFGFVFQQSFLIHYLTVLENVLVGGDGGRESVPRALELLAAVGLEGAAHRLPHQLSGGERQRAAVARALVAGPDVVFADEPTAALDRATGHQVIEQLAAHRRHGALVVVTHDPEMLAAADTVWTLRDGRLQPAETKEGPIRNRTGP
jgi:putative ABC transport system ATP-binding protein